MRGSWSPTLPAKNAGRMGHPAFMVGTGEAKEGWATRHTRCGLRTTTSAESTKR
jgi:hypothetical protein